MSDTIQTPPAPVYLAADFASAFQRLLPSGPVWPRDANAVLSLVASALAPTYERMTAAAGALLQEAPAGTLVQLLPEWEATLGLPDPCAGEDPTLALRQAHVRARVSYDGGQSIPYFVGYAAALGYAITVTEFAAARADHLVADGPVYDPSWAYAWQVNAPSITVGYFAADVSYADDPLETWGNLVLVCELSRIKPAHTALLFSFG